MAVPKFEYFPTRAAFDTARGATTVFNNSVVFIEDTMELFTHGHFWTVSNLSQYYNSATQKLQLKNGSTVISELDASPFIKDGMLESVELVTTPEVSVSSSVTIDGTTYPIEVLDANDFNTYPDSDYTIYVIPPLDTDKAYKIIHSGDKDFVATESVTYILRFCGNNANDFNLSHVGIAEISNGQVYTGSSINSEEYWNSITFDEEIVYSETSFYGIPVDGIGEKRTRYEEATETTASASNPNYPTLPYLKFTFNTFDSEPTHTVIRVSIAELFTVYNGDNVLLSSNYAKAQTYTEPAVGDKVDIAVGKLAKGISDNAAAIATKQAAITGAATSITSDNLTASKALVSDANGKVAVSSVTATELGYLSGVTSSIQTQLNAKANIADLGWVEH